MRRADMRFVTAQEFAPLFGPSGFAVGAEAGQWRAHLTLDGPQQRSFACQAPPLLHAHEFIQIVSSWFRSGQTRLLWVTRWEVSPVGSLREFAEAARRGDGANAALSEAPGLLFDAHPHQAADWELISRPHSRELALLAGF